MSVVKLYSVTSIIKQGLGVGEPIVNWAAATIAEAAFDQFGILEEFHRTGDREAAVDYFKGVRFRKTKKAMMRGSEIHAAAEQLALGQEPTVIAGQEAYVEQYLHFLERFQPQFLLAEAPVYNLSENYAGTLDGVMELEGRPYLFDIKTTEHPPDGERSRPPYEEVALQLVAYSRAEQVGLGTPPPQNTQRRSRFYPYDPDGRYEPLPQVDREMAICLVLSPYDCSPIPVRISDDVWNAFLYVKEAARYRWDLAKRVYGAPMLPPEVTVA